MMSYKAEILRKILLRVFGQYNLMGHSKQIDIRSEATIKLSDTHKH